MRNYVEILALSEILLEESYVLDVECHPGSIVFKLEYVLTERHAEYRSPKPNETYCYRSGRLVFESVTQSTWKGQGAPPAHDLTGELDWGNIDSFLFSDRSFQLEGDWGQMDIIAAAIRVELT